jgi:hypothetical protein
MEDNCVYEQTTTAGVYHTSGTYAVAPQQTDLNGHMTVVDASGGVVTYSSVKNYFTTDGLFNIVFKNNIVTMIPIARILKITFEPDNTTDDPIPQRK